MRDNKNLTSVSKCFFNCREKKENIIYFINSIPKETIDYYYYIFENGIYPRRHITEDLVLTAKYVNDMNNYEYEKRTVYEFVKLIATTNWNKLKFETPCRFIEFNSLSCNTKDSWKIEDVSIIFKAKYRINIKKKFIELDCCMSLTDFLDQFKNHHITADKIYALFRDELRENYIMNGIKKRVPKKMYKSYDDFIQQYEKLHTHSV